MEVALLTEPGGRDERWSVVCILPVYHAVLLYCVTAVVWAHLQEEILPNYIKGLAKTIHLQFKKSHKFIIIVQYFL